MPVKVTLVTAALGPRGLMEPTSRFPPAATTRYLRNRSSTYAGQRVRQNQGATPLSTIKKIIGILAMLGLTLGIAAIAIPAYQNYTIRAQVAEGINMAALAKAAIADNFQTSGEAPADRAGAAAPTARDSAEAKSAMVRNAARAMRRRGFIRGHR